MLKHKKDLEKFKIDLLEILRRDSLLASRVDDQITYLKKNFEEFEAESREVILQIEKLVDENPSLVTDITRRMFVNNMGFFVSIYSLAKIAKNEEVNPYDKMVIISKFYELSHLYNFAAYLFSGRKENYESFSKENPGKTLKYLKRLNLSRQDADNMRLIRNSINHNLKIESSTLIFENGETISISQVEDIYLKCNALFSWWSTLITTSLFYLPKFGIIVLETSTDILKNNPDPNKFVNTLGTFFPEYKREQEERKEKKKLRIERRKDIRYLLNQLYRKIKFYLLTKYYSLLSKNKYIFNKYYRDNFDEICSHMIRHSNEISNELNRLASETNIEADKERYLKIAAWFSKGEPLFRIWLYKYRLEGMDFFLRKARENINTSENDG